MANFIWTGILYFSTFSIVLVTYRVFIQDRKAERERISQELMKHARASAPTVIRGPVNPSPPLRP